MKQVNVYACGGAGINITVPLYEASVKNRKEEGFAKVKTIFIDTSRSNLPRFVEEGFYQVMGSDAAPVDGSGKARETNYKAIFNAIPDILSKHPAADLNIVVHSAGGGSGGVIGSSLVSELLASGNDVIVIMVGSTTCVQEIKNTINTILSYQAVSQKRSLPVVAMYLENNTRMSDIDAMVRVNILTLAAVWSGENHGLDSRDLHNFLNYQKVTKYQPSLCGLTIVDWHYEVMVKNGQALSSMVTLVREGEDPSPGTVVGYHSFGHLSEAASKAVTMPSPIFLNTVQGYFPPIVQELKEKLSHAESLYEVPIAQLNVDGQVTDDGLVL